MYVFPLNFGFRANFLVLGIVK